MIVYLGVEFECSGRVRVPGWWWLLLGVYDVGLGESVVGNVVVLGEV